MSPQVAPKSDKTFSFDTIAVLLAVMESHSVKLGSKHYQMMSALDGKRGYNSFQHEFREVKKRAAELAAQLKAGEEFVPVDKTRGHSAEFTALPGQTSKKRSK
ncbi:hypothetical protein EV356DRAFT_493992 [Viridothelium virens]|uniref:Uncharacterized protein n=1 Tax=Viridothelium virens TaxID=1048519 RepID=A0A6A6GU53_VIRVR|nr:hypothetical protein EV356DRAFT_493992 [Viridothelium virens]